MQLACFDFDGTITKKDTFLEFIKFTHGKPRFYAGFIFLSPILLLYKAGFIPNWRAKEWVISYFYKGYQYTDLENLGNQFALQEIPALIRPAALARIQWHLAQAHRVIIISASLDVWLKSWCDKMDIQLIATHLEVKQGVVTGKLGCQNCYGSEKVNRIKKEITITDYQLIHAYGDSRGDKEMLDMSHKKYYREF